MKQETLEEVKDLAYWKKNAEEDYLKVPISVLRYISEIEERSYSEKEFAIDFAEWCDDNYFRIGTTSFWAESLFDEKAIAYKTEELLKIYKKTL